MQDEKRTYTPPVDVVEPLSDGTGVVVVARAGKPMPWARALALGLVKDEPPPKAPDKKAG